MTEGCVCVCERRKKKTMQGKKELVFFFLFFFFFRVLGQAYINISKKI